MPDHRPYWFRAKTFGWGWGLPLVWQGWAVIATFCALFILGVFLFPIETQLAALVVWFVILNVLLIVVCWLTGEPPRWRWGKDGD